MPTLGRTLLPAALAAALVLTGCGGEDPIPQVTLPTNLPSIPTDIPTGVPSGLGTNLTEGTARVELSGGVDIAFDVPLITPSVYNPPPGAGTLSYGDTAGNAMAIGGALQEGPTSALLVVTITTAQPEITLFISQAGECTLAIEDADQDSISGTVECSDLDGGEGGPTDATITFEASA